jgi:hypothetical protein
MPSPSRRQDRPHRRRRRRDDGFTGDAQVCSCPLVESRLARLVEDRAKLRTNRDAQHKIVRARHGESSYPGCRLTVVSTWSVYERGPNRHSDDLRRLQALNVDPRQVTLDGLPVGSAHLYGAPESLCDVAEGSEEGARVRYAQFHERLPPLAWHGTWRPWRSPRRRATLGTQIGAVPRGPRTGRSRRCPRPRRHQGGPERLRRPGTPPPW